MLLNIKLWKQISCLENEDTEETDNVSLRGGQEPLVF
jgi:hypothetical protein